MPNPAPLLRLFGRVHTKPVLRAVLPLDAKPEERDPAGNIVRRAREARAGYDVYDVTVLTDRGGFVNVVFREEAIAAANGYLPEHGDELDGLPVMAYVNWQGQPGRKFASVGYSFAGSVYADEQASSGGSRIAAAS